MEGKGKISITKIVLFIHPIFAIVISFTIINNLFYLYVCNEIERDLFSALEIISVIFNIFVLYYAIKTVLAIELEEKINFSNNTSSLLFVSCWLFIFTERLFQLLNNNQEFHFFVYIPLIFYIFITICFKEQKQQFKKKN